MAEFKVGDRVKVVNASDPDLNGMRGYIAGGHPWPFDYNVSVEVAAFMGELAPFRSSELELIGAEVADHG